MLTIRVLGDPILREVTEPVEVVGPEPGQAAVRKLRMFQHGVYLSADLQSGAVRAVLPRASEEAIHRDYFVLA